MASLFHCSRPREFWRLDYWEDDLRRRRRFVRNPLGSTHPEATLKTAVEHAADEDLLSKGKQSIKRQALGSQDSENEILPEGDDDTLSSVDEKDLENLTGKFTACADFSVRSGPISISLLTFSAVTTRTTKFTPTITLHKNFLFPQTFFS